MRAAIDTVDRADARLATEPQLIGPKVRAVRTGRSRQPLGQLLHGPLVAGHPERARRHGLDHQHPGEVRLRRQILQHVGQHVRQVLRTGCALTFSIVEPGERLAARMVIGREEALLAVVEQLVEGPARHPGTLEHVADRRLGVPLFPDRLGHRGEGPLPISLAQPVLPHGEARLLTPRSEHKRVFEVRYALSAAGCCRRRYSASAASAPAYGSSTEYMRSGRSAGSSRISPRTTRAKITS